MKKIVQVAFAALTMFAATMALAQSDAQKSFDRLKVLSGNWEGTASEGKPVQVVFRDSAGGSALISEIHSQAHLDMVSMIHLDGPSKLLLTHYCSAGNQPRMQASTSADGKTITFKFIDATNLATPDAGHMQTLVVTMADANHHTEEWTFANHGQEMKEVFDLHRQ
jgi:hypothetical protein